MAGGVVVGKRWSPARCSPRRTRQERRRNGDAGICQLLRKPSCGCECHVERWELVLCPHHTGAWDAWTAIQFACSSTLRTPSCMCNATGSSRTVHMHAPGLRFYLHPPTLVACSAALSHAPRATHHRRPFPIMQPTYSLHTYHAHVTNR